MTSFARLRHLATCLPGRVLLAWFALTIALAVAAPVAHSRPMPDICTSAGAGGLFSPTGEVPSTSASHLDCPLCVPTAPPSPAWLAWQATQAAPSCPPRWSARVRAGSHERRTPPGRAPPLP